MDRNNSDSWCEDPYGDKRQMHTPAMWRVRQSPKIHRAFADLWGTDNLWINMDSYNTSSKPRLAQFLTMWPATEEGHETGLRVFWPSSPPSNDGSALGEKCGGLEAERHSRIAQWREGLQTDFGRPVAERVAGQDDVPSCPLSPLGRRILGLDLWPAE